MNEVVAEQSRPLSCAGRGKGRDASTAPLSGGNLHKRVFQHKFHHFRKEFTDKYDVTRLRYWESYDEANRVLAREAA